MKTLAAACSDTAARSFWFEGLARRAGGVPVHDWLVCQANLRGHRGAWTTLEAPLDAALSLEELVVGLLHPSAPADGRVFKLVVRMLQSADIDGDRLELLARQERATGVLHWLLAQVPASERNDKLAAVAQRFASAPRGFRGVDYRYDARRLVRRAATEDAWRRKPS